jgi:hypothetical protein
MQTLSQRRRAKIRRHNITVVLWSIVLLPVAALMSYVVGSSMVAM